MSWFFDAHRKVGSMEQQRVWYKMSTPGVAHRAAAGKQLDDVIEMHINLRKLRNFTHSSLFTRGVRDL